jgi:hypothetical protein
MCILDESWKRAIYYHLPTTTAIPFIPSTNFEQHVLIQLTGSRTESPTQS